MLKSFNRSFKTFDHDFSPICSLLIEEMFNISSKSKCELPSKHLVSIIEESFKTLYNFELVNLYVPVLNFFLGYFVGIDARTDYYLKNKSSLIRSQQLIIDILSSKFKSDKIIVSAFLESFELTVKRDSIQIMENQFVVATFFSLTPLVEVSLRKKFLKVFIDGVLALLNIHNSAKQMSWLSCCLPFRKNIIVEFTNICSIQHLTQFTTDEIAFNGLFFLTKDILSNYGVDINRSERSPTTVEEHFTIYVNDVLLNLFRRTNNASRNKIITFLIKMSQSSCNVSRVRSVYINQLEMLLNSPEIINIYNESPVNKVETQKIILEKLTGKNKTSNFGIIGSFEMLMENENETTSESINQTKRLFNSVRQFYYNNGTDALPSFIKMVNSNLRKNQNDSVCQMCVDGLLIILRTLAEQTTPSSSQKNSKLQISIIKTITDFISDNKKQRRLDLFSTQSTIKSIIYQSFHAIIAANSSLIIPIMKFFLKQIKTYLIEDQLKPINETSIKLYYFDLKKCISADFKLNEPIDILLHCATLCYKQSKDNSSQIEESEVLRLIMDELTGIFDGIVNAYVNKSAEDLFEIYKSQKSSILNNVDSKLSMVLTRKITDQIELGLIDVIIEHSLNNEKFNILQKLLEYHQATSSLISIDLTEQILSDNILTQSTKSSQKRKLDDNSTIEDVTAATRRQSKRSKSTNIGFKCCIKQIESSSTPDDGKVGKLDGGQKRKLERDENNNLITKDDTRQIKHSNQKKKKENVVDQEARTSVPKKRRALGELTNLLPPSDGGNEKNEQQPFIINSKKTPIKPTLSITTQSSQSSTKKSSQMTLKSIKSNVMNFDHVARISYSGSLKMLQLFLGTTELISFDSSIHLLHLIISGRLADYAINVLEKKLDLFQKFHKISKDSESSSASPAGHIYDPERLNNSNFFVILKKLWIDISRRIDGPLNQENKLSIFMSDSTSLYSPKFYSTTLKCMKWRQSIWNIVNYKFKSYQNDLIAPLRSSSSSPSSSSNINYSNMSKNAQLEDSYWKFLLSCSKTVDLLSRPTETNLPILNECLIELLSLMLNVVKNIDLNMMHYTNFFNFLSELANKNVVKDVEVGKIVIDIMVHINSKSSSPSALLMYLTRDYFNYSCDLNPRLNRFVRDNVQKALNFKFLTEKTRAEYRQIIANQYDKVWNDFKELIDSKARFDRPKIFILACNQLEQIAISMGFVINSIDSKESLEWAIKLLNTFYTYLTTLLTSDLFSHLPLNTLDLIKKLITVIYKNVSSTFSSEIERIKVYYTTDHGTEDSDIVTHLNFRKSFNDLCNVINLFENVLNDLNAATLNMGVKIIENYKTFISQVDLTFKNVVERIIPNEMNKLTHLLDNVEKINSQQSL
jgi:hypothetical protein